MGHSTRVPSFKGQGNSAQVGFCIIPISWVFQKIVGNPKNLRFWIFRRYKVPQADFCGFQKYFLKNCYKIIKLNDNEWSRMNMNDLKALE